MLLQTLYSIFNITKNIFNTNTHRQYSQQFIHNNRKVTITINAYTVSALFKEE